MVRFHHEYYRDVMNQYGYSSMELEEITFHLGEMSREELATHWLCHFKGEEFAASFKKEPDKCIVTTG